MTELHVVRAGALTTVQDLGRPGWAHLGVPRGGALDVPALRLANHLVGNPAHLAGLETTLTGCELRFTTDVTVAVTGATTDVTVDGHPAVWGAPVAVPAAAVLGVGRAAAGVRSYLAVTGGVDVPPVLGSRSTDTLTGIGPAPLADGAVLPVGTPRSPAAAVEPAPGGTPAGDLCVRVTLGPRDDWFTGPALRLLTATAWTVTPASNRVGMRLDGPPLRRRSDEELPSEGVVLGAVQVPADGRPIVFLADHPTTGGYPVIAVVDLGDLPALAQARPGATLRFSAADEGGARATA
jgi:biotin-dependent carboxylase-like uncharacterized protein